MKRYISTLLALVLFPLLVHARTEGQFDRTLSVSGAVSLDVTTGSGDITVKTGSSNQVVIHGRIHGNDWLLATPMLCRRCSPILPSSRAATPSASATTFPTT